MATSLNEQIIKGAGGAVSQDNVLTSNQNMLTEGQAYDKIGNAAGNLMLAKIQQKKQEEEEQRLLDEKNLSEWDDLANKAAKSGQYMNEQEYASLVKQLEKDRLAFIDATSEQKAVLLSGLENRMDNINDLRDFRTNLSSSALDEDGFKNNTEFLNSNVGQSYKSILSGDNQMTQQDGEYGYMIHNPNLQEERLMDLEAINAQIINVNAGSPDFLGVDIEALQKKKEEIENQIYNAQLLPSGDVEFTSVDSLNKTIQEQSFDRQSNNIITEMAQNAMTLGGSVPPGRSMNFNYEQTYSLILNDMVSNGNMRSLWKDKHVGGMSAEKNLYSAIMNQTYSDFGVTREELLEMDPTQDDDGFISDDDAKSIVKDFFLPTNKDMANDYIARYFTNFVQQNFKMGFDSRAESTSGSDNNEDEFIPSK